MCLDVRAYRARDSISRRAKGGAHLVFVQEAGVGVPGCEGPSTHETHFQAGQRRTWCSSKRRNALELPKSSN